MALRLTMALNNLTLIVVFIVDVVHIEYIHWKIADALPIWYFTFASVSSSVSMMLPKMLSFQTTILSTLAQKNFF